jgi:hypothetical protein
MVVDAHENTVLSRHRLCEHSILSRSEAACDDTRQRDKQQASESPALCFQQHDGDALFGRNPERKLTDRPRIETRLRRDRVGVVVSACVAKILAGEAAHEKSPA